MIRSQRVRVGETYFEQPLPERERETLPGSCSSKQSISPSIKINTLEMKLENRICKICKKGFSSGKALAGHMRVHAQGQKQQIQLHNHHQEGDDDSTATTEKHHYGHHHGNYKRAASIGNANAATTAGGGPLSLLYPICSVCGKIFQSMKSLFGHMRCHPEREWRGIQPTPPPPQPSLAPATTTTSPKNTSINSSLASTLLSDKDSCVGGHDHHLLDSSSLSTNNVGSSALNLAESLLSSWSLTGKRGRKAIAPAVHPPCSEPPIPDVDVVPAYNLMLLSQGNPLGLGFPTPSSEESDNKNVTDYRLSHGDQGDQLMFEMILSEKLKKKQQKMRRKKKKIKYIETFDKKGLINYKQQQPTTVIATAATSLSDRFKCRTCNKTFMSHQALGGHRSSHKIGNKNSTGTGMGDSDDDWNSTGEEEEDEAQWSRESPYRCKICKKGFPTGQALGGHQRIHWRTVSPNEAGPSSPVASPEDVRKERRGGTLEFDLNELPVMTTMTMEDDDEEKGGGLDSVCFTDEVYPASFPSYNSVT